MSDSPLIVVEVMGQPAAFTVAQLEEARMLARELIPSPAASPAASGSEPLLDAEACAKQLGVTGRWLEDGARLGIVPHYKLGRFIRFRVSEIAAHCRSGGAAIPGTDLAGHPTDTRSVGRRK